MNVAGGKPAAADAPTGLPHPKNPRPGGAHVPQIRWPPSRPPCISTLSGHQRLNKKKNFLGSDESCAHPGRGDLVGDRGSSVRECYRVGFERNPVDQVCCAFWTRLGTMNSAFIVRALTCAARSKQAN